MADILLSRKGSATVFSAQTPKGEEFLQKYVVTDHMWLNEAERDVYKRQMERLLIEFEEV